MYLFKVDSKPIVIFQSKNIFFLEIASFLRTHKLFWCVCVCVFVSFDNIVLLDEFRVKFIYIYVLCVAAIWFAWLMLLMNLFYLILFFHLTFFFLRGETTKWRGKFQTLPLHEGNLCEGRYFIIHVSQFIVFFFFLGYFLLVCGRRCCCCCSVLISMLL